MLDSVKAGDTVELSLLLAFMAGGSSFSHIVLISALGLKVWLCENGRGVQEAAHGCSKHPM